MFLVLAFILLSVSARILNVTIDDTLGDERTWQTPQYAPDGWIPRSVSGAPCDGCTAQPDATHIYKGTWHDKSTFVKDHSQSNISLSFSGTRIYVYFILSNNIGTVNHNTRLRFYLDGSSDPTQDFLHLGDPSGVKYLYDQLVYDSQAMEPANHTLIVSSYSNGTDGSVALFDRAVYTTGAADDPATQIISTGDPAHPLSAPAPTSRSGDVNASRTPRLGLAIGGAITVALVLALLLAGAYRVCSWRRCRLGGARVEPLDARIHFQGAPTVASWDSKATAAFTRFQPSSEDSSQLRCELGRMREELERVRRIAEPPQYTHVSGSS